MAATRVVLLGFMASGKSEVGRRLAARLGWRHVDLDEEIERETGRTVEDIFRTDGEPAFRALEVRQGERTFALEHVVVSPGGGWITNAGVLENLPADTLTVWLQVSPERVLARVAADPNQPVRPLLRSPEPKRRVVELMTAREPLYRRANVSINTDEMTIDVIVDLLDGYIRRGEPIP